MDKAQVKAATIFTAVAIPDQARAALKSTLKRFQEHIDYAVPTENWHMTLVYSGKTELGQSIDEFEKDMSLSFVPTVSITHIGLGKQPDQLWAYIHATPAVHRLRQATMHQLATGDLAAQDTDRPFVPHIRLANLKPGAATHIADAAAPTMFPVREIALFRSHHATGSVQYERLAAITITA